MPKTSQKYNCIDCGKHYKLTSFCDTEYCEDCIDKQSTSLYEKEYETDVFLLKNPSGKTAAVFLDD